VIIEQLAEMVVGNHQAFPYRSSSYITKFFHRCGLPFAHDGSTRSWWATQRLKELNPGPCQSPDLPSDSILRVIAELFDPDDFDRADKPTGPALAELNKLIGKQSLEAYLDAAGRCYLRNTGTGMSSSTVTQEPRPLTAEEIEQRSKVAEFLGSATEDDFTERLLVPLFQRLGFHRVSPTGHQEKLLEYGKDLWMKYQLPTGHWIYFGAQIKREKLDSKGNSGGANIATVLNQVGMALAHPIFDPDNGRKVLVDHMFVISAAEITRSARQWLIEQLDQSQRRHIIFMDREEFLNHSARILLDLVLDETKSISDDDIPF
jgi:hypothetical protein